MAYDINAALERLEKNLSKVESAKKQVEETITTSKSLQHIISGYSESLHVVVEDISVYIEEIRNCKDINTKSLYLAIDKVKASCDDVINKFNTELKTSTDTINTKLSGAIVKFNSENERLISGINSLISLQNAMKEAIQEVTKVKDKIDNLSTYLTDSQKGQDRDLANIKSSLKLFSDSVESRLEKVSNAVNSLDAVLKYSVDKLETKVSNSIQFLSSVDSEQNEFKSKLDELKKNLSIVKSATVINRWILVIAFIVLVALHFFKI